MYYLISGTLDPYKITNNEFQLLYKDIPFQENQLPHFFDYCLVLDFKVLRDLPHKVYSGRTGEIISGDLRIIKKEIKECMYFNYNYMLQDTYRTSHRIVFDDTINLEKYHICSMYERENGLNDLINEIEN